MNPHRKKQELVFVIQSTLSPLIDNDYLFLDLPYHNNLGDSLIWQGTEDFLSSLPYKCLIRSSYNSNEYVNVATDNPDSVILLHGGGNFGDLWPMFQKFRKTVITQFPGRKILILPQTIHYNDNLNLEADSVFFAKYPNVTICVRDNKSLELAKKYFSNNKILLIPDMAFCIDMSKWQSSINRATSTNCLFVKREDKELSSDLSNEIIPDNAIVSDWPTINNNVCKNIIKTGGRLGHFDSIFGTQFKRFFYKIFVDPFFYNCIRPRFVKIAIGFLSKYHTIYTTRLHVSILSVLLEKKNTIILDNSYGKNSAFYETWLSDVDGLELYKKE